MADETRSVLLEFNVDLNQAKKDLDVTESKIIDLKKAQADLNKEFKNGTVSQEEYVKANQQLNASLQKESQNRQTLTKLVNSENGSLNQQRAILANLVLERNRLDKSTQEGIKAFDELNKQIKELNDEIKEHEQAGGDFRRNVGNYADALKGAAGDAEFFGVNVGSLTDTMTSFLNPATAAIGLVSALAAAYGKSSVGALDLEAATSQLSTGFSLAANSFGNFIQSISGAANPQNGPLASLAYLFNRAAFGLGVANQAKAIAAGQALMKQLEISQAFAAGYAKDSERIAENFRRIRDDEEQTVNTRVAAADRISKELERSELLRISVLQRMIEIIPRNTIDYQNNREAQLQVAQLTSEIKDIEEEINGKLTENLAARKAILKAQAEEAAMMEFINKRTGRTGTTFGIDDRAQASSRQELNATNDLAAQQAADRLNINERLLRDMARQNDEFRKSQMDLDRQKDEWDREQTARRLDYASAISAQALQIFGQESDAYRLIASADATINAYKGANIALGTYPPPYSYIVAALTVATGLANVARINNVKFDSGGYTGSGFGSPDSSGHRPAGIVHANEYVVPKWQVQHPAYSPIINTLESGRLKGYADGGLVTNSITSTVDTQLATMNTIRQLPAPVVSVKEITKAQGRVQVREQTARLGNK